MPNYDYTHMTVGGGIAVAAIAFAIAWVLTTWFKD